MARLERNASVHSPTKSRVKVAVSVRHLPAEIESCYAVISLASGGYVHDRDTLTTEIRVNHGGALQFESELLVDYLFEEKQFVNVALYRCSESSTQVSAGGQTQQSLSASFKRRHLFSQGTLIGSTETTVGRVIHGGGTITQTMQTAELMEAAPELTVRVQEYLGSKESIILRVQGHNLDKKDLFGKSDPYICIERKSERGKKYRAYRTEVVKNTLNPEWRSLKVSIDRLCNGDLDNPIYFRCFDWDGANGDPEDKDTEFDELIGEFLTTAREILSVENEEKKFELINPRKKRKKKGYLNSGTIALRCHHTGTDYSFLDYMFGGSEMNFTVAIDLTASNGDVHQASSLHYIDSFENNEYAIAIQAVLEILHDYDSDQLFPAFGFGARVPPDFKICHEYPLSGDYSNVFCQGVDGVMEAYRRTLREVKLSGPTYFAPVIRYVIDYAKNHQDGSHYFVLLILTDGSIDDWNETKKAVIETSYLPVSIIVVGIGGGKFAEMEVLDQDFGLLKCGNEQALRDNVQFVQLRKYMRPAADGSDLVRWSKVALAKDVLNELPDQVMEYMKRRALRPPTRK